MVKEPVRGHWGTIGDSKGQEFQASTYWRSKELMTYQAVIES